MPFPKKRPVCDEATRATNHKVKLTPSGATKASCSLHSPIKLLTLWVQGKQSKVACQSRQAHYQIFHPLEPLQKFLLGIFSQDWLYSEHWLFLETPFSCASFCRRSFWLAKNAKTVTKSCITKNKLENIEKVINMHFRPYTQGKKHWEMLWENCISSIILCCFNSNDLN